MTEHHDSCHALLRSLSDYVEGDLPAELCSLLEEHIRGCANCRIVVDTFKKSIDLVHGASSTPVELPEPVKARLFAALDLDRQK